MKTKNSYKSIAVNILILFYIITFTVKQNTPLFACEIQTTGKKESSVRSIYTLKTLTLDTRTIMYSPMHWGGNDWLKFSLVTGVTAGLFFEDKKIQSWFCENRNSTTDRFAQIVKPVGEKYLIIPAWGVCYLAGSFTRNSRWQKFGFVGIESSLITSVVITGIKYASQRHRPNPDDWWDKFSWSPSQQSFPSGHAAIAFSVACVITNEWKNLRVIPYIAYGLATATCLSRLNDDEHWASDVFFGAVTGYFTTQAVIKLRHKKIWQLKPEITKGQYCLRVNCRL